jgi:hypothetical protein
MENDSMIFHLSIDAGDPRHVATVLAELFGGEALPFPPVAEGSWVAMAGDERGTTVEVYPRGTGLMLADGDADAYGAPDRAGIHSATHFAMATDLTEQEVLAIAEREGWPAKYRKRGGMFGVIELWIEGARMVEVLTSEMQREYLDAATIANFKAMLAAGRPVQLA